MTSALVKACRARGVTASGALCAAAAFGASDAMGTLSEDPGVPAEPHYLTLTLTLALTLSLTLTFMASALLGT